MLLKEGDLPGLKEDMKLYKVSREQLESEGILLDKDGKNMLSFNYGRNWSVADKTNLRKPKTDIWKKAVSKAMTGINKGNSRPDTAKRNNAKTECHCGCGKSYNSGNMTQHLRSNYV
jgi:hypothetical protein